MDVKATIAKRDYFWKAIFHVRQRAMHCDPFWTGFINLPNELIDIVLDHAWDHSLAINAFKASE